MTWTVEVELATIINATIKSLECQLSYTWKNNVHYLCVCLYYRSDSNDTNGHSEINKSQESMFAFVNNSVLNQTYYLNPLL